MKFKNTYIIAEIGSNHNNNIKLAKKSILKAKKCGADAVKFQLFKPERLYSKSDPRIDILAKFKLNPNWIGELNSFSKKNKIDFFASPFDKKSVDILIKNGVKILKIASPEIRDYLLIEHIASKKVFTILSTGVSTFKEVKIAKKIINKYHNDLAILQCSSIYPCDLKNVNLSVINSLKKRFRNLTGLSDHSLSIFPPIAAVAFGAKIIEKHFTLSRKLTGPDHSISIEPHEFKKMVEGIRAVELSIGSDTKKILKKESLKNHKKSFYAAKEIAIDEKISKNNIELLRSPKGIDSKNIKKILLKKSKKVIHEGEMIKWEYLK